MFLIHAVQGYHIEFVNGLIPVQRFQPQPIKFNAVEEQAVDDTISSLLDKGVLELSRHEPGEFVNTIFVRPKKDSETVFRMILNLKPLNKHVVYH